MESLSPSGAVHALLELCGHAGPGEIEEPDIVGGGTQLGAEAGGFVGAAIEQGEVQDGEVEISHVSTLGTPHAGAGDCFNAFCSAKVT